MEGIRYIGSRRDVTGLIGVMAVFSIFGLQYLTLIPVIEATNVFDLMLTLTGGGPFFHTTNPSTVSPHENARGASKKSNASEWLKPASWVASKKAQARSAFWLAAVLAPGLAWHVRPRISVSASLQLVLAPVYPTFQLANATDTRTIFEPAVASGRLLLGVELRIRDPW